MRLFWFLAAFVLVGLNLAQEKTEPVPQQDGQTYTLQLKGKKGDQLFYREQTVIEGTALQGIAFSLKQEAVRRLLVEKVDEDGTLTVKSKVLLLKMKKDAPMGEGYFDSEKGEAKGLTQQEFDILNKQLEKEETIKMTKEGKMTTETAGQTISFVYLPDKPVKIGDSWTSETKVGNKSKIIMKMEFTLKEVKEIDGNKVAVIGIKLVEVKPNTPIPAKIDSKGSGTLLFDIDAGRYIESNMKFEIKTRVTNPQTGEEMVVSTQKITVTAKLLKEKPNFTPKKVKLIGGAKPPVPLPVPPKPPAPPGQF